MSINLFDKISSHLPAKKGLKMFSIEFTSVEELVFHKDQNNFMTFVEAIHQYIDYIINVEEVNRLTIMAVETGADAFLYYLSLAENQLFQLMDKVVLINCGYMSANVFHWNYRVEYKRMLLRFNESSRRDAMNSLRIVSIQTKAISRRLPESYTKLILISGASPQNFVSIESRYIWSVYTELTPELMFYFNPFVSILSQFIILDLTSKMSIKQIDYFFRFKENPKPEPAVAYKRQFTLDCKEVIGIQTRGRTNHYADGKYYVPKGCYKFRFSFSLPAKRNQSTGISTRDQNLSLLIECRPEVQVFTEKYIQIPPFLSDPLKSIYYIKNLSSMNGVYVRNPRPEQAILKFAEKLTITEDNLEVVMIYIKTHYEVVHLPDVPLRICQETPLIFPLTESICLTVQNPILIKSPTTKFTGVYIISIIDMYRQLFKTYFVTHKNAIICYFFGLHLFNGNPYPLLGIQPIFLYLSSKTFSIRIMIYETILSLSLALFLHKVVKLLRFLSQIMNRLEQGQIYFYSAPLVFVPLAYLPYPFTNSFNQWLCLIITALGALKIPDISVINIMLIYLNVDYCILKGKSMRRFIPMQLLLLIGVYHKKRRIPEEWMKVLNNLSFMLMNIFISEDVSVIQTILEFHVMALAGCCLLRASRK